jgi:hypothetical protein
MTSLLLPRRQLTLDPLRTYFLKQNPQKVRLITLEKRDLSRSIQKFLTAVCAYPVPAGYAQTTVKISYVA